MRVTTGRKTFKANKFSLGRYSEVVGWVGGSWLLVSSVILFFPSGAPVDEESMNYAVVVVVGALVIAGIWWVAVARHNFVGPPRTDDGQAFSLAFMKTSSENLMSKGLDADSSSATAEKAL